LRVKRNPGFYCLSDRDNFTIAMNTFQQIIYHSENAIASITLNRPEKRNALGTVLIQELKQALAQAEMDAEVRVIVIRAAGKDFCAGMDLAQLEKISQASILENIEDATQLAELFLQIRRISKPVIAAVHGRALAGGAGLASACDLIVATRSAQFAYTETRIGFVPALVSVIARRNLSEKIAFEWLTSARPFSAEAALQAGFINRVCEENNLSEEVEKMASVYLQVSASAVALTKRLLYQMDAMSFEQSINAAVNVNAIARMTEDCQQGINKFLVKP
jgi:methylglutaconyl-CoA hydratase